MIRKKLLFFMPLILVLSMLASLVPKTANAATGDLPVNDKLYNNLSAYQHYQWLNACFSAVDIDEVTKTEVDNWDFFQGTGQSFPLGAMYDKGENGVNRRCDDENMVQTAFSKLGASSSRSTFCSIPGRAFNGEKNIDKETCLAGKSGKKWDNYGSKSAVSSWFRKTAKYPPLTNSGQYMRSYLSLIKDGGCQVKFIDDKTYASAGAVPDAGANNKYVVPVMVKSGKTYVVKYARGVGKSRSTLINYVANGVASTGRVASCNDIVKNARSKATAYASYINRNGTDSVEASGSNGNTDGSSDTEDETECAIDGIGWLVCPVMSFIATLNDKAFDILESFLAVSPKLTTDDNLRVSWQNFRDIANIAFVIAFMIIIYSQLTGQGISNYGLKRLLPKLILTAILVNMSLILCQIAVDISDILGNSVYSLFKSFPASSNAATDSVGSWANVVGGILTAAAGVALLLAVVLAPVSLLALGIVILILVARKAAIVLLIVLAPLAFVAYLLPNTESWFKKWWKAFSTLLMLYPIVGAIFGASFLAANIINSAGGNSGEQLTQLTALGVMAIPLFAVPLALKGALSGLGSIGNRLSSMQDRANGRARKQFGEKSERYKNRFNAAKLDNADKIQDKIRGSGKSRFRRIAAGAAGYGIGRSVANEQKDKYAKIASEAAERNYIADRASADEKYAQKLAGGNKELGSLVQSYALQAQDEEFNKDVNASRVLLRNKAKSMSADDYREHLSNTIKHGETTHDRVAAMNEYGSVASDDKVEDLANTMSQLGAAAKDTNDSKTRDNAVKLQRAFSSAFNDRMPINVGATDKANMQSGNFTNDESTRIASTVSGGKISSSHIGRMKFDEMKAWNKQMSAKPDLLGNVDPDKISALESAITAAENDPRINVNFGERERTQLKQMKQQLEAQFYRSQGAIYDKKADQDTAFSSYQSNGNVYPTESDPLNIRH